MRRALTPGIRILIIINVALFLLGWIIPELNRYMIIYGGLVPQLFTHKFFFWQPLTYMFLHGGFGHVFFNMFALWMFGTELERQWGTKFFMKYYFLTGIAAGILSAIVQPASPIPIIGASGAIYGLLLAFALMYPNRIIYFNFFIPIKVKYFVMIFAVIELFSSISASAGSGSGVAHFTHLSGMIFGYLYLLWKARKNKSKKSSPFKKFKIVWDSKTKDPKKKKTQVFRNEEEEIQYLLNRINKEGYASLSEDEKERLLDLTDKYRS